MDSVLKNLNDCLELTSDLKGVCVFEDKAINLIDRLEQKILKSLIYISTNFPEKRYFPNQENDEKWENVVDGKMVTVCYDPEPFSPREEISKIKQLLTNLSEQI